MANAAALVCCLVFDLQASQSDLQHHVIRNDTPTMDLTDCCAEDSSSDLDDVQQHSDDVIRRHVIPDNARANTLGRSLETPDPQRRQNRATSSVTAKRPGPSHRHEALSMRQIPNQMGRDLIRDFIIRPPKPCTQFVAATEFCYV